MVLSDQNRTLAVIVIADPEQEKAKPLLRRLSPCSQIYRLTLDYEDPEPYIKNITDRGTKAQASMAERRSRSRL